MKVTVFNNPESQKKLEAEARKAAISARVNGLVAAASEALSDATRSEADAKYAKYLSMWGEEFALGLEEALEEALKEVGLPGEGEPEALTSAIGNPPLRDVSPLVSPADCLSESQKRKLASSYSSWLGVLESRVSVVVDDVIGVGLRGSNLDDLGKAEVFSIPAPVDTTDEQIEVLEAEGRVKVLKARKRDLDAKERALAQKQLNSHQEAWAGDAEMYSRQLEADDFFSEADRRAVIRKLEKARQQLGLSAFTKDEDGVDIFWNKTELTRYFEDKIREDGVAQAEAAIAKAIRRVKRLRSQDWRDYSWLWGYFYSSVDGQVILVNRNRAGRVLTDSGLRRFPLRGGGFSDIEQDIKTVLSVSRNVTEANKAAAYGRLEVFVRNNANDVVSANPRLVRNLTRDKRFLNAMRNPRLLESIKNKRVAPNPRMVRILNSKARDRIAGSAIDYAERVVPNLVKTVNSLVCAGKNLKEIRLELHDRMARIGDDIANHTANQTVLEMSKANRGSRKVWVSALVADTRVAHRDAHNQTVDIGVPFTVGGCKMDFPLSGQCGAGANAGCICRLKTFVVTSGGETVPLALVD